MAAGRFTWLCSVWHSPNPLHPVLHNPPHPPLTHSHTQVENRLQLEGQRIPNLTHPEVPISNDEDAATVLSMVRDVGACEGCRKWVCQGRKKASVVVRRGEQQSLGSQTKNRR